MIDGLQQRPLQEEPLVVQLLLQHAGADPACLAAGLGSTEMQELARVVPVVDGLRSVDALVALQPDQLAACPATDHLGDLGLADACLAFEQQWTFQCQRQEHRRRQPVVGQVAVQAQCVRNLGRPIWGRQCSGSHCSSG